MAVKLKWMYFLIEDDELLQKYNNVWSKVSNSVKKELDATDVHDKKYPR